MTPNQAHTDPSFAMRPENKLMTKYRLAILLATLAIPGMPAAAATECADGNENIAIPASSPTEDFIVRADGTALQHPSRLIWMRCALGQTWTGSDCSGQADEMNWEAALQAANDFEFAGLDDWRLPNRNELGNIIEQRCHSPAINHGVFPSPPGGWFWSSSPAMGNSGQGWAVMFDDGQVQSVAISGQYAVRLVRAGRE